MKYLVVLFLSCHVAMNAQLRLMLREDSAELYVYSNGDEFNNKFLNESVWKNGLGGRSVLMAQDMAFDRKKVKLKDGFLLCLADTCDTLQTLQDWEIDKGYLKKTGLTMNNSQWRVRYRVGGIVSKEKLHYGIHELRFKVQDNQGTWPAFWFFGGVQNEEIDVFEMKGERPNEAHVDVHCPSGCDHGYRKTPFSFPASYGAWMPINGKLSEGFQVMSLDWREDELCFYLNGQAFAYFKGSFSNPMNLFINTSVAKTGEGFSPGPNDKNHWPDTFAVDYYRYWKKSRLADTLSLVGGSSLVSQGYGKLQPTKESGVMFKRRRLMQQKGELSVFRNHRGELVVHSNPLSLKDVYRVKLISGDKTTSIELLSEEHIIGQATGEVDLVFERKKAPPLKVHLIVPN